jgi:hypothetical protein
VGWAGAGSSNRQGHVAAPLPTPPLTDGDLEWAVAATPAAAAAPTTPRMLIEGTAAPGNNATQVSSLPTTLAALDAMLAPYNQLTPDTCPEVVPLDGLWYPWRAPDPEGDFPVVPPPFVAPQPDKATPAPPPPPPVIPPWNPSFGDAWQPSSATPTPSPPPSPPPSSPPSPPPPPTTPVPVPSFCPRADEVDTTYATPGSYVWTAPSGVSKVHVVCVGAGGGPSQPGMLGCSSGGGGGGLVWANDIPVHPCSNYTVVVGAGGSLGDDGGASFFLSARRLLAEGGGSGVGGGEGGCYRCGLGSCSGQRGGDGGACFANVHGGGGSAGGYTEDGADGATVGWWWTWWSGGQNGRGGSGGGGATSLSTDRAGGGGGTGLRGLGAWGAAGDAGGAPGQGGSSGEPGGVMCPRSCGGRAGGGAGGALVDVVTAQGGHGACRIVSADDGGSGFPRFRRKTEPPVVDPPDTPDYHALGEAQGPRWDTAQFMLVLPVGTHTIVCVVGTLDLCM